MEPAERGSEVGLCSTRPSAKSGTPFEAGVDTFRLLFETHHFGERAFEIDGFDGWRFGSVPTLGQTWAEGHPSPGSLASASEVASAAASVREAVDERFGVMRDLGVARTDQTVTVAMGGEPEAKAFIAGMSAFPLPRLECTRRGRPPHSVWWTHPKGRKIAARVYDKGLERGGAPWESVRLEDQRRYSSTTRLPVEVVADADYLRGRFEARFGPVRKAVQGVRAATFPVIAKALADEARYGYRSVQEAERLAGSLVLLTGGAAEAYSRRTFYRRRSELRDAGYVVVDDVSEVVEVELSDVVESALQEGAWA